MGQPTADVIVEQDDILMAAIEHGLKLIVDIQIACFIFFTENFSIIPRSVLSEYYIKLRCTQYFYFTIQHSPRSDPLRFQRSFRIWPDTFDNICNLVRRDLETHPPIGLEDISNRRVLVQRQVAIALVRLASGMCQLSVGNLFGLSQPTICLILWKFVKSVVWRGQHFIAWPRGQDMDRVKHQFFEKTSFVNCCGAIDGTHVPITKPPNASSKDYYDWHRQLSINVQAISDYDGRFLNFSCGWPGSLHDSRVLRISRFYQDVDHDHEKLEGLRRPVTRGAEGGTTVQEYILGDGGYPCLPWLVVLFPRHQNPNMTRFNKRLSSGRSCIERAFSRFKGIWRINLKKMNKSSAECISYTIYCCAILHNMILAGDPIPYNENGDGEGRRPPRHVLANGRVEDQQDPHELIYLQRC